jgi:hypothetical protein
MPNFRGLARLLAMDWQPISTAPRDEDIEVCVIQGEPHVLVGACRLTMAGWINANTRRLLNIHPTHWRETRPGQGCLASLTPKAGRAGRL